MSGVCSITSSDDTSRDTMCGLFGVGGANVSALLRHRGLRLCELHAGEALVIPTFGGAPPE